MEQSFQTLNSLHYSGEKRGFPFEKFITKMSECFETMKEYGDPYTEMRKVREFLTRISDPKLESAKAAINISPLHSKSCQMASDFLSQHISTQIATRNISSTKTSKTNLRNTKNARKNYTPIRKFGSKKAKPNFPGKDKFGKLNSGKGKPKPTNSFIPCFIWDTLDYEKKKKYLDEKKRNRNSTSNQNNVRETSSVKTENGITDKSSE